MTAFDFRKIFGILLLETTDSPPTIVNAAANIPTNRGLLSTKYVGEDSIIVSSINCADAPGIWARVSFRRSLNLLASLRAIAATRVEPRKIRAGCFEFTDAAYPLAAPAIPDPMDARSTSSIITGVGHVRQLHEIKNSI